MPRSPSPRAADPGGPPAARLRGFDRSLPMALLRAREVERAGANSEAIYAEITRRFGSERMATFYDLLGRPRTSSAE